MGTAAQLVDVGHGQLGVTQAEVGLGPGEQYLSVAEERDVGVVVVLVVAHGAIRAVVGPLHDAQSIGETRDLFLGSQLPQSASHTSVEHGAVVSGGGQHVLSGNTQLAIQGYHVGLGSSTGQLRHFCLGSHRHLILGVAKEFGHQRAAGEHALPLGVAVQVRHTVGEHRGYDVSGVRIALRAKSVAADGEDGLLHGLRILVVVAHEELCVATEAVLLLLAQFVGMAVGDGITIVYGLLQVVHLSVGVHL